MGFEQDLFENVGDAELAETVNAYQGQTAPLWNQGMANDSTLLQVLAVGRVKGFDYLMHLTDDYSRKRIQHFVKYGKTQLLEETEWANPEKHKHFGKLKNIQVEVKADKGDKGKPTPCNELAKGAVQSFFKRIMPKLMFIPICTINGSLEVTVQYMVSATEWINNLLLTATKNTVSLTPFQFDLCFAVGEPNSESQDAEPDESDDEEDDDDDDNKDDYEYFDFIGNIDQKLKANKLENAKMSMSTKQGVGRVFDDLYKKFKEKNDKDEKDKVSYLQSKRIISMIDRRVQAKDPNPESEDTIYMYEPPKNAQNIPKQAVPEWFISSARTSLLPDIEYDPSAKPDDEKEVEKEKKDQSLHKNIHAQSACKQALLTLSFHVKQEDVIKLYLYHNGQSIRFMPSDIKDVLPILFNMKWMNEANKRWLAREKEVNSYIERMERCLKDVEFEAFQQSYID